MSVPDYDLGEVKASAKRHDIEYRGRNVQRDISNLGYELSDVAQCLMQLSENEFSKSIRYENHPTDDEYMCKFTKAGNEESEPDDLYIKFRLIDSCQVIDPARTLHHYPGPGWSRYASAWASFKT